MDRCDECNNIAVWFYMPGSEKYCEKHVPRGCSCTRGEVDELGRDMPCCEYFYDDSEIRNIK